MDNLDYIDSYFAGEFPPEETSRFEQRIREDAGFAGEVAYFIAARTMLKEASSDERRRRFLELYRQQSSAAPVRRIGVKRWLSGPATVLAAAVVLVAAVLYWLLFFKPADPSRVADRYIAANLTHLSVKMGVADSMQLGLDLYNRGQLSDALRQFAGILQADSLNPGALLDAGIVSLRMGNYDKALDYFTTLSSHTDPRINPALFYEALTLLKRDRKGDTDLAKQVLKRIVQQDLDKKNDAQELLGRL